MKLSFTSMLVSGSGYSVELPAPDSTRDARSYKASLFNVTDQGNGNFVCCLLAYSPYDARREAARISGVAFGRLVAESLATDEDGGAQ